MPTNSNVCGQRIDSENHTRESLPKHQANLSKVAYSEVEDTLAIIAEIQSERMNEDGDITEPLTLTQIRTVLEVCVSLQRSLTILEAIQDGSEGAL